jgi:hypothetical protein
VAGEILQINSREHHGAAFIGLSNMLSRSQI